MVNYLKNNYKPKIKIMASTTETGHSKNVANFDDFISFVTGYGTAFDPSKASIKLTALPFQQVPKM